MTALLLLFAYAHVIYWFHFIYLSMTFELHGDNNTCVLSLSQCLIDSKEMKESVPPLTYVMRLNYCAIVESSTLISEMSANSHTLKSEYNDWVAKVVLCIRPFLFNSILKGILEKRRKKTFKCSANNEQIIDLRISFYIFDAENKVKSNKMQEKNIFWIFVYLFSYQFFGIIFIVQSIQVNIWICRYKIFNYDSIFWIVA